MRKLDDELYERKDFLKKVDKKIKRYLKNAPTGHLRATVNKGTFQYRIISDDDPSKPQYISKSKLKPARNIAQRDYYIKALKYVTNEIKAIEKLIKIRKQFKLEELYDQTKKPRRALLTPLTLTDEEYARRWQEMDYQHKYFENTDRVYTSFKGEKMRSKSEVIIANILYLLGIPYHYEYPLELINGRIIYVDFLILDVKNRKEIWYEHFGMMGDMAYADPNTDRFNDIVSAGLIPGDNFIATFETYNKPLDTRTIFKILEQYRTNEGDIDLNQIEEDAAHFD